MSRAQQLLVAGGGIGAMATATALSRIGWDVRLFERAEAFAEVGAGLQLGPNVTHILHTWGLEQELAAVAAFPDRLQLRCATSGAELGVLSLGRRSLQRYGAPYATVHRADLHALLLRAASSHAGVRIRNGQTVLGYEDEGEVVRIRTSDERDIEGDALIGADGLLSAVRQQLLGDGPPRMVGDLAYRSMLHAPSLPAALRLNQVTAWLGPDLHVVQYPVRGGRAMNVVALIHGPAPADPHGWDHSANTALLYRALKGCCHPLRELIASAEELSLNEHPWRMWVLADRPPVTAAHQMARGLVALLGDAAHPMRPYMAQGAGMAIEDAFELAHALGMTAIDVPTRLRRYALTRWQRVGRVQARSERNGRIFHARGLMRLGRNASMRVLGERLLDVPWLYGSS